LIRHRSSALPEFDVGFTDRVILLADRRPGHALGAVEGPLRLELAAWLIRSQTVIAKQDPRPGCAWTGYFGLACPAPDPRRPQAGAGNRTAPAKASHPACTARTTAGRASSAANEPPRPSAGRRRWSVSGEFRTSASCSARSNDWCAHPSAILHGC
jgi:hypothetical protein